MQIYVNMKISVKKINMSLQLITKMLWVVLCKRG